MIKIPFVLYSNYLIYGISAFLIGITLMIPQAYSEQIHYSNSYPVWYMYDCADSSPTSFTLGSPADTRQGNVWKYFSYYNGNCYVTLHTFDFQDLPNLTNTTSMNYYIDTRSMILNNPTLTDTNPINCELYYFGKINTSADISQAPTVIASSYDCTETQGKVISSIVPFSVSNNATMLSAIQGGNYSQSFMLFPDLNSTMRSHLDSSGYVYAIGKFDNSFDLVGSGFNCIVIEASNWCNMYNDPWGAIKKSLGEDYLGSWFYVFVFFPIPFMVFLVSRNGTYAGFVCLPIILFINTIDQVVFEISLSLMALAGAFGFYEMLRKRLVD